MDRLELTPSESCLLLDIEKKDGKTLMKYSLVNLLYKRTLSSEVREVTEGTVFKKVVKKTYVSKGEHFNDLNLKPHEKIFCSVMGEHDEVELVELIQKIFEQYDYNDYHELLLNMQCQSGLLNITEERKFFNIFSKKNKELTDKGIKVKTKIKEILSMGKNNLSEWVANDPPRAKAFMAACGANLMLMDGYDIGQLKTFEEDLKGIDKQKHDDSGFLYWGDGHGDNLNDVNAEDMGSLDAVSTDFNSVSAFDSFDGVDAGFDSASGHSFHRGGSGMAFTSNIYSPLLGRICTAHAL